jgi:hypothetical protein
MSEHVLIQHAKRKPFSNIPDMPEGSLFDHRKGYWVMDGDKLVTLGSQYGATMTKKCDQETGEDQKGE